MRLANGCGSSARRNKLLVNVKHFRRLPGASLSCAASLIIPKGVTE